MKISNSLEITYAEHYPVFLCKLLQIIKSSKLAIRDESNLCKLVFTQLLPSDFDSSIIDAYDTTYSTHIFNW